MKLVTQTGILSRIYVKFKDESAGLSKMRSESYVSENNFVPVVRIEANCSVSLKSGLTIHGILLPLMPVFACTFHKV